MRKRSGVPCDVCGEPTWTPKASGKTTARHKACKPSEDAVALPPAPAPEAGPVRSVSEAAKNGTTRELLEATRDRIALAVDSPKTPARELASLTKRLMETVREIEAIDARQKQEDGDGENAKVEDGKFDPAAI